MKDNFGTGIRKGTFKCADCGKLTRETLETENTGMCSVCYRYALKINSFSDGEISEQEFKKATEKYKAYLKTQNKKGHEK